MLIRSRIILILFFLNCSVWAESSYQLNGHTKYRLQHHRYTEENLFQRHFGEVANDQNTDLRLNFNWQDSRWNAQTDYQLIAVHSDTLQIADVSPDSGLFRNSIQSDKNRLFDLTHVLHEEKDAALLHRLDRLFLEYTSEKLAVQFGRQAVSWGNGLVYTPFDFFNPFDPTAIDKEYKAGDDLFYGQYLYDNGNDLQLVRVFRRNNEGGIKNDVSSTAVKLHGLLGNVEYDFLMAQHYGETIIGLGGNMALGGAIWHGDLTYTDTETDRIFSLVTGASYSWVWGNKNYSGLIEYFYNGFGINRENRIDINILLQNSDLINRLQRGEIHTVGKHSLAASVTIELSPLWQLQPNTFQNLSDGSLLFQLLSKHSLSQNTQLLLALDIPFGSSGTEYGGIESATSGLNLGKQFAFFAQLGWYF